MTTKHDDTRTRRTFLAAAFAGAAAAGWGGQDASADPVTSPQVAATQRLYATLLDGFTGRRDMEVKGSFPPDLTGRFLRNGPYVQERFGQRVAHFFDGDGAIAEFTIQEKRIGLRVHVLKTPKFQFESRQRRLMAPGFGSLGAPEYPAQGPDSFNPANISVLYHGGRLFALWEGGSALELDPITLESQGFLTLRRDLVQAPFGAHPKLAADGSLWNVGVSAHSGRLGIYHLAPGGTLVDHRLFSIHPLGAQHDFLVTKRHVVVHMSPWVVDEDLWGKVGYGDAHVFRPELGSRVLVAERDDLSKMRIYNLPAGFLIHHGQAQEDALEESDGTISYDGFIYPDAMVYESLFHWKSPKQIRNKRDLQGYYGQIVLRPNGSTDVQMTDIAGEFPRSQVRLGSDGKIDRRLVHVARKRPGKIGEAHYLDSVSIIRSDGTSGEHFLAPEGVAMEEHIWVQGRSGRDFILGTALDFAKDRTGLLVFDPENLSAGPLAEAWCNRFCGGMIPHGLHGMFLPA